MERTRRDRPVRAGQPFVLAAGWHNPRYSLPGAAGSARKAGTLGTQTYQGLCDRSAARFPHFQRARVCGTQLLQCNQLWIAAGFGHACVTSEPDTEVLYKVTAPYSADAERGMRWDSPGLEIDWPLPPEGLALSAKDTMLPTLAEFVSPFDYEGVPLSPIPSVMAWSPLTPTCARFRWRKSRRRRNPVG